MNLQIEDRISEIAERARTRYGNAISAARKSTEKAAGRVSKGKKPVKAVSRLGVRLSGVSYRTANKLWKRQTKLVESQIDALAGHLKAAAAAPDLRNLVETQMSLIPQNANRFKDEARAAFGIFKGAGSEIRDLVKGAVVEFRGKKPAAKKAATTKKPAVAGPVVVSDDIAA